MNAAPPIDKPTCTTCLHYFITYEPRFPYGCRAMNFKCRVLPHLEVETLTGAACLAFQRRRAGRDERR